ncbi:hypothetical protein OG539_08645 [Actinacidiphila glaucinigra]|uniref:hypothetical protein n=1 Tax=Actinacidiphila glaucinigra TaxID=235986 RepID=UPI002DD8C5DB|nr:hypothetical protein [Actinacidiphila glaucinigra]WSD63573.1 hypothetical protein OIE69_34160 [Actinacidiphila glaucinigra]
MSYVIVGFCGVFAGIRALVLLRRQRGLRAERSSRTILRPRVPAVLAAGVLVPAHA